MSAILKVKVPKVVRNIGLEYFHPRMPKIIVIFYRPNASSFDRWIARQ